MTVKPRPGIKALLSDSKPELSFEEKAIQFQFWIPVVRQKVEVDKNGVKTEEPKIAGVNIDLLVFYEFLYNEGFRRFDHNDDCFYVRITNGRILKRTNVNKMMDCVGEFIATLPKTLTYQGIEYPSRLIEAAYVHRQNSLLDDKRLKGQLRFKEEIRFNQDTAQAKYMYFLNGYLKIDVTGTRFKEYKELKGFIWDSELLRKEYKAPKTIPEKDYTRLFMLNVCGGNQKRFEQLQNITGYLMHNYMSYKLKCVLLTDGVIDPEGEANGRSGKSLYARIVGGSICNNPMDPAIKSYVEINGKDFDPTDKHKYSAADIDTKLIVLNDLKRYFDVDLIFNDITEGMNVDKKSLQPFRINTKMIATTNKIVRIEGGSSKDRFVEFEFSDHYNDNHSPQDDFGIWFFKDWTDEDYCRYYSFMASCAHKFFKDGTLAKPEAINLNKRKLIESTDPDFLDFVENDWRPVHNQNYEKIAICAQFQEAFPDWKQPAKKFTQNRFSLWVKNLMNYSPEWENYVKNVNDIKARQDGNNTTTRYYRFIKKKEE